MSNSSRIRPLVRDLHAYVPGEQPKIKGLIKLNTNENPYPPSPRVLAAVKAAVDGRLRLYPNPTAQALREKLAKLHRCRPENIIIGNGSDEVLALAVRAFVEPSPKSKAEGPKSGLAKATVQYFTPSYSLYPVLADIHGAAKNAVPLKPNFSLPGVRGIETRQALGFQCGADFRHDAECAERSRLQDCGVGKTLPRAEGRRGAGRGVCGFRAGKRAWSWR